MLTKGKKSATISKLKDRLGRQTITLFTSFRGTPVGKLSALRRLLKKDNAEYTVAKKTLFDRALAALNIPFRTKSFEGEIGAVFGYRDQSIPAKTLVRFSKQEESVRILGGILGSRVLDAPEVLALAKIPSREILLAELAAALAGPLQKFASALQGNIRNLLFILENIKNKKSRE